MMRRSRIADARVPCAARVGLRPASALLALAALALTACAAAPQQYADIVVAEIAVDYRELPGWRDDDVGAAIPAIWNSCSALAGRSDDTVLYYNGIPGPVADWRPICNAATAIQPSDRAGAHAFFEAWFTPVLVYGPDGDTGLFTGYFAPELNGSWTPSAVYATPIYRPPGRSRDRGRSRAAIVEGALAGKELELLWVDDPIDAFFLEIQGSGNVRMADGSVVGVKIAGQNGQAYYPIGRYLVESGVVTIEEMSMEYLRRWMEANPESAQPLMNLNRSYVYFKIKDSASIIGAQGVPLTAGRSLAVDPGHIPLGTVLWLDLEGAPVPQGVLRRLVVAQDTGGAIDGAVRGDVYWGEGDGAGAVASGMRAHGRYLMLLPRATVLRLAEGV